MKNEGYIKDYCIEKTEEWTPETKLEIKCDTSLTLELDTNSHTKCDTTDNKTQESKFDLIEDHVEDKVSQQVKEDDTKCDTKQNEAEETLGLDCGLLIIFCLFDSISGLHQRPRQLSTSSSAIRSYLL